VTTVSKISESTGASQVAAAEAAAEDAARRAAEEAARRAAEEAAKKAAEEAAKRAAAEAAHAKDEALMASGSSDRLAAYTASTEGGSTPADAFNALHGPAVAQLPHDQKDKLRQVVKQLCDPATQPGQLAERTLYDLGSMLETGVLAERDQTGKTILDHLAARVGQPLAPPLAQGLNEKQQAGAIHDIIHSVANPGSINQGVDTFTCTTAVVQTLLAVSMPADYVAMTTGLMFDGVGRAPTGELIKLDTAELFERELGRKTGRGITDAVVQGSLLSFAQAALPSDGKPAAEGGRFSASYVFGGGRFSVSVTFGGNADGGLTSSQVGGLLEKVLGIKTQDIEVSDTNRDLAYGMFTSSLETAKSGKSLLDAKQKRVVSNGIPVGVETSDGKFHEILVTDIREGKVVYIDPVDGKSHEMAEDDFKAHLKAIKVPSKTAPSRFTTGTGTLLTGDSAPQVDQAVLYGWFKGRLPLIGDGVAGL
jgi:hypothetical protein